LGGGQAVDELGIATSVLSCWIEWFQMWLTNHQIDLGPFPVEPPERALVAIQAFLEFVPHWRSDVGIQVRPN
jgi:hypothetical protein